MLCVLRAIEQNNCFTKFTKDARRAQKKFNVMRYYIIFFFCIFSHASVNSQSVTISTFEKQVVYAKIKNPLNVSAFHISPENLILETDNGVVVFENNVFYWTPGNNASDASLSIKTIKNILIRLNLLWYRQEFQI